jgi:cell volume regulation protein A
MAATPMSEPFTTALVFLGLGGLLAASAVLSRASQRLSVPLTLLFLALGVLAGSEGIGRIPFNDFGFAFRLGSAALVLILFDGGLKTPLSAIRKVAAPAGVLATLGVIGTAALVATFARLLGLPWAPALLLGAVVSSTDAAAVFSVLRSSGTRIDHKLGATLEVESGFNDPMAVILTTVLTKNLLAPGGLSLWSTVLEVIQHVIVGGVCGVAVGMAARAALTRYRLPASGLYPVLTLGAALLAFSIPTLLHGSGFLGVYVAAVVIGSGRLPYRASLLRVHDALAWLGQVSMFLMLGLLVFPTRLVTVAPVGLVLGLLLAFVARPLVVALCLVPFRYRTNEKAYLGWVGLRGAVPIVLAVFPVLAGAPGAEWLFNVVFFIVLVNSLIPGATVPWVTRKLGLASEDPPPPEAVLEVESHGQLNADLLAFSIDDLVPAAGALISELPFPDNVAVTMIVRGEELIAPKGATRVEVGDHVYVIAPEGDRGVVELLFGPAIES